MKKDFHDGTYRVLGILLILSFCVTAVDILPLCYAIRTALAADSTLTFSQDSTDFPLATAGRISDFSSWGLNDQLAIGALTVMRANGIEIPRQVQVIGFDNIEESQYLQIPLTTMDSRLEWTAPTAVERILGRIRGEIAKPELLMTDCNVIVRDSTR